jgi:4-alpha-glucanotransferase
MPLGYHWFSLEVRGQERKSLIIAAPTRAFAPTGNGWERSWGVFLPLHALNSRQSLGAGEFGDLGSLCEWAGSLGASFVGTLPLLAAFLDEPFEISPYSPVSRLFWNEFYLNISQVPELRVAPRARERLESIGLRKSVNAMRSNSLVDYRRLMELKRPILEELAKTFFSSDSNRRTEFESFASQRPRLDDYAIFRAIGERLRTPWPQWDGRLRECAIAPSDYSHEAKRYHMYVQWLAHTQLQVARNQESGAGLYMDLPLGVNSYGYDVWRERYSFAVGVTGGCPPDIVFPGGQNWGFVPLHPEGIRNDHYRYVKDYLRHLLSMAKILRIDHMQSFHRVFWIPPGRPASEGAFVRYHAEEMYAVFSLESHRHKTMLVGEDLGTVPPEVPTSMYRHNFHRMYVTQYELKPDPGAPLPVPPAASLAMVNTHDMAPFAGFWQDFDLEERRQAGLLAADKLDHERTARSQLRTNLSRYLEAAGLILPDADVSDILRACLINLRDSPARMLLLNLEDLWQETHSQNIPSTSDDSSNWRRKARFTFEEFSTDAHVLELLREVGKGFNCFARNRTIGSSYARL